MQVNIADFKHTHVQGKMITATIINPNPELVEQLKAATGVHFDHTNATIQLHLNTFSSE